MKSNIASPRRKQLQWLEAAAKEILDGAMKAINELDLASVEKMIQMIMDAKDVKIFVVGMGRSGFVGRAFALRLMNLGFNVYFLGETITPAAGKDDLVIAVSGTGETKMVLTASSAAKEIGARVVAVTSYPESPLGKIADQVVSVKGRTRMGWPREEDYLTRQILGEREPLSPLGSIFENNCMIFLDCLIVELMYRLSKTEEELRKRHATIEQVKSKRLLTLGLQEKEQVEIRAKWKKKRMRKEKRKRKRRRKRYK